MCEGSAGRLLRPLKGSVLRTGAARKLGFKLGELGALPPAYAPVPVYAGRSALID